MKRLLFAISSLSCGGAEKSLLTLLGQLDPTRYQMDLFLLESGGFWVDSLPSTVRIIPRDDQITVWDAPLVRSVWTWIKRRRWNLAARRLLYSLRSKCARSQERKNILYWEYKKRLLPHLPDRYDTAIAYLEGSTSYFVWQQVQADRKLAYIHGDYTHLATRCHTLDTACFQSMDRVVAVSRAACDLLQETFPTLKGKFTFIENIVSPSQIRHLAEMEPNPYTDGFSGCRILTVGRLAPPKGIDLAIEACRILVDGGMDIRWHVLGDGPDREKLQEAVAQKQLESRFILEGARANPAPYLKHCDLYVQPSRHEAWGIAIEEAKVFAKPIVITRFIAAPERIEQGLTGLIVDISPQAIAAGIRELIENPDKRHGFSTALENIHVGNENEMEKFMALLDTPLSAPTE